MSLRSRVTSAWTLMRINVRIEGRAPGVLATSLFLNLFWGGWALALLLILFQGSSTLLSVDIWTAIRVLGLYLIVNGIRQAFVSESLETLLDAIRVGYFEALLLYPVPTRLLLLFRSINISALLDCVIGSSMVGVSLGLTSVSVAWWQVLATVLLLGAATAFMGFVGTVLKALVLVMLRTTGLDVIISSMVELARFPPVFYGVFLAPALLVTPIALFTYLPSSALTSDLNVGVLGAASVVWVLSIVCGSAVWNHAEAAYLRHGAPRA